CSVSIFCCCAFRRAISFGQSLGAGDDALLALLGLVNGRTLRRNRLLRTLRRQPAPPHLAALDAGEDVISGRVLAKDLTGGRRDPAEEETDPVKCLGDGLRQILENAALPGAE